MQGIFTHETNPAFIIPALLLEHLLCTKIQNEFVAVNIIFKKGDRERNVVSFKHPELFSASITPDSLICPQLRYISKDLLSCGCFEPNPVEFSYFICLGDNFALNYFECIHRSSAGLGFYWRVDVRVKKCSWETARFLECPGILDFSQAVSSITSSISVRGEPQTC